MIDAAVVAGLSPATKLLTIVGGQDDTIVIKDVDAWRMSDPFTRNGKFMLTANNIAGGNESLEAELPHPWQNFLQNGDINNDGSVTVSDALRLINELARRDYSSDESQYLQDPLLVENWPNAYFDQNGDDHATALDALRVINYLASQELSGGPSEAEAVLATLIKPVYVQTLQLNQPLDPAVQATRQVVFNGSGTDSISAIPVATASTYRQQHEDSRDQESARAVDQLLADESTLAQFVL
jgi:hypothetical protein